MNRYQQTKMIQYALWPNCNNNCSFCLKKERDFYSLSRQFQMIDAIKQNINFIDWSKFPYGISLLGGEIYNITNKDLKHSFLELVNIIIDKVLSRSDLPHSTYSSVTNGIYDPEFLFNVMDLIKHQVGMGKVDLNFSYDLKYRYRNDSDRITVLKNINEFHKRYDYMVGVQMILTQYVINFIRSGEFDINRFLNNDIPGSQLSFLYPHEIHTGIHLDDFKFSRKDFLWFLNYLRAVNYRTYLNFVYSTKNSSTFKYSGLKERSGTSLNAKQQPLLTDGKEIINNNCGHSVLYKCYSDSDKCMLCDIYASDSSIKL